MLTPPPPLALRPMTPADVAAVQAIDRLSFPTPTKTAVYQYELTENKLASYQVLTLSGEVIGYAGYWQMGDEIHISTIAAHPDWRRRGVGALLLLNLLQMGCEAGAALVTLEVRRSNKAAQALYARYEFEVVGERRRYYKDTGEDAVLMTAVFTETDLCRKLPDWRQALWERLACVGVHSQR